jgi:aminopeptidase N
MSIRVCIVLFVAVAVAVACGAAAAPAQRPTGVIGAYVPPRSWPQEPRRFDLLHQKIEIRFDAPLRELFARVTTRVAITLAPTDTVRLDAEHLLIDRATDARGRALRFTQDTAHVTVRLARRAATGDTVEFALAYHAFPERGLYFVPRRGVIWSQGEATETPAWIPTYDAPNDKTTWEFLVTADSGMKVLSNGRLAAVTPVNGGAQRVWHWVQDKPASTYLTSVVVGPFVVLHDEWRGRPVEYWTYPDTVDAAWRAFGETPAMIELFSQVLGVAYPWDKYAQSIVPDFIFGGMENVSATTQTEQALHASADEPDFAGRSLDAHELAHQWFGDLTTSADWADVWLNEGLTTYMESVQEERTRGWDAAEQNWYGQQQLAMQADLHEVRALVWGQYRGSDPNTLFFSGHVYPKGAQLAHQLRRLLGDSLFWAGMHRFLVDNAYRPVTTADYAIAMEQTCRCDLDWFFDQWAYGIGYPQVRFARQWAPALKTLRVTVTQSQPIDPLHPLFQFPATIRVITRDSVVHREIFVRHQTDTFAIVLPSEPLSFRFDEGGWLLGTVIGDLTAPELAQMAKHDLDIRGRRWALAQLEPATDSVAAEARRFVALNEHAEWLRALAVQQLARDSNPASRAVVAAALRDPEPGVRAAAVAALAQLDPVAAGTVADAMVGGDPSNAVRAAALRAIANARGADAVPVLVAATAPDRPPMLRVTAARLLGATRDPRGEGALERLTDATEQRDFRTGALGTLAETGDSARATAVALRGLDDPDPLYAAAAVRIVARVGGTTGKARLARALQTERRVRVRAALEQALAGTQRQ